MRKKLMAGVLAAAVTALVGIQGTGVAAQAAPTFTIYVHFEYESGFSYDYPVERGVTTAEMPALLQYCGSAHQAPSVVRFYCYPVAE
jgi:hypothetical protein